MSEALPPAPSLTELSVPPPLTKDDWEYEPRLSITLDSLDIEIIEVPEEHDEGDAAKSEADSKE